MNCHRNNLFLWSQLGQHFFFPRSAKGKKKQTAKCVSLAQLVVLSLRFFAYKCFPFIKKICIYVIINVNYYIKTALRLNVQLKLIINLYRDMYS